MKKVDHAELKSFPFFSTLLDEEVDRLLPFLECRFFTCQEVIVREGALADRMFFVRSGRLVEKKDLVIDLGISGLDPRNEICNLKIFQKKQHCCEHVLVHDFPLSADLTAEKETELIILSRESFAEIGKKYEPLAKKLLLAAAVSLAETARDQEKILVMEAKSKILIEEMRIEKKKILAMHRIARSTAESSVQNTLKTILDACMDCLDVEKGSVMIFDRGRLRVESAFGLDRKDIMGKEQEIREESISGRCFITQKPILIKDITGYQGIKRAGGGTKYSNNSLLSIPLVSLHGESIGVLNVSKTSEELFDQRDLDILNDLATEAAAALGHEIFLARLFKKFQGTYAGVKKAREQMEGVEDQIFSLIRTSWQEGGQCS
ncbi:MAG: GAF domain-containing protein [Desulfobulbaceae bacterium]|nr:GAF domain-containing protein [Desulfobulbaceae bacterium]